MSNADALELATRILTWLSRNGEYKAGMVLVGLLTGRVREQIKDDPLSEEFQKHWNACQGIINTVYQETN